MQLKYWSQLTLNAQIDLLKRNPVATDNQLTATVVDIIDNVRQQGDAALYAYAKKFDRVQLTNLLVTDEEYKAANSLSDNYKQAIKTAHSNIYHYHSISCPKEFSYTKDGIELGKIYRPIEKVGLYVPGGSAVLVSTLMMLAIPAQIAQCPVRVLVTPPRADGTVDPAILFAAMQCGINQIYKAGGAQAVAALAYGTQTIPKVHKIFGPGNKYVTAAKMQVVNSDANVAIDMPAGPSEVLVIGDEHANFRFIASDLLAQAEHDTESQVIFVTTSEQLAQEVSAEVKLQLEFLSRKTIIRQALNKSAIIIAANLEECFKISNLYAPEHLIIHAQNAEKYLKLVVNAGSIFVGEWSPESAGDYASGTNHVLPTYGYANMYSGLDVISFMKAISWQKLSKDGIRKIGKTIEDLAELEGLDAHKNAVTVRLQHI